MGAVSSCCSLVPMRSSSVCFLFPCCFSFICSFPWRLVRRLVLSVSSCVSSRASRLVRSVRRAVRRVVCRVGSPSRLVGSSRFVVSYGRRSVLLSACSRLVRRGVIALSLSCRLVGLGVPPFVHRPVLVSRRFGSSRSSRLVSVVSFSSVISFCLIRGRLGFVFMPVPVFAPFRPARRSFLPHSIRSRSSVPVSVSVVGRGCVSWAWGGGACSCRFIRSMLLSAHPLPAHVPSFLPSHRLIAPIAFSYHHPKQENERGRRRRAIERETRKQRGGYNKTP